MAAGTPRRMTAVRAMGTEIMLASSIIARRASAGERSAAAEAGSAAGDDIFVELDWWSEWRRRVFV
jgi:hypothetical protein